MNTEPVLPARGEIWLINFDPTIGAEIKKTRPALILSINSLGILPLKLVVPITGWRNEFLDNAWHIFLGADEQNGLQKNSALDLLQIKSIDERRLVKRLGSVDSETLSEALKALLIVVGYQ
ncbi:MAG: type II toxin-antitoxin system PemK/MazF family toxin [Candidatus Rifleibacteriota bacterium]